MDPQRDEKLEENSHTLAFARDKLITVVAVTCICPDSVGT
jgi:hypothetical protein